MDRYRKPTGETFELNTNHAKMLEQGQLFKDCHKPTHEQMIEHGYYKEVPLSPTDTQKLGTEWVYEGEECWVGVVGKTAEEKSVYFTSEVNRIDSAIRREQKRQSEVISSVYPDFTVAHFAQWKAWGEAGDYTKFDNFQTDLTGHQFWLDIMKPKVDAYSEFACQLECKKNNLLRDLYLCENLESVRSFEGTMNEIWDSPTDFGVTGGVLATAWKKIMDALFKPW